MTVAQIRKDAKKQKIDELRAYIKSLSKEDRQELASQYGYTSIDGHTYSHFNQCMIGYQTMGKIDGILAGFNQWKRAGRIVRKGQKGILIWIPSVKKSDNSNPDEIRFYTCSIFDISQTDEMTN